MIVHLYLLKPTWVITNQYNGSSFVIARIIALDIEGVFLVSAKNAFVPVKQYEHIFKNFNCPTRE